MLNAAQFSAAKNDAEVNMLIQASVFDENKVRKGYSEFKRDAKEITNIFNDTWLRTEYDTSVNQAVNAELFNRMKADADIYPYWEYERTISRNPRDEHLILVGNVYRIGDPDGDRCHPQNGWNCGCGSRTLSDMEVEERGLKILSNDEAKETLKDVNQQFRFNSSIQGILPKEGHSYFEALPNANAANGELFNITGSSAQKTKLGANGLHNMLHILHNWRHDHHSTIKGVITFQNSDLYTNIVFNQKSFKAIQNNSAGFELLADTVTKPNEVWSLWSDVEEQTDTKRIYIRDNYCVQTYNGTVINAYLVDDVNRFRHGCLIW